jgi:hypothetical protein
MVFKSAKSKINSYIFIGAIILLIVVSIPSIFEESITPFIIIFGINAVIILILLWIYTTTFYSIKNEIISWKSGPFNGKIAIKNINRIEHHKGIIVPTICKPALSHIGLIITYNKYNDIYISPENSDEFILHLLKTNPNITIKNNPYAL